MDKAFEAFDRAIKENPDRADAYYYRALVYINRNKHPEAKADLQKLLALEPNGKFADDAKAFLKDLK
jgi:tetratricopeptide (TPR) repeat protein